MADPGPEQPSEEAREFLGSGVAALERFAELLEEQGELRGLIGPRERDRLWSRHILNSAAVCQFLPDRGDVADVGSGAGFPGIVIAALRPDLHVHLIEPMQRRVDWLHAVGHELDLDNLTIHRARADELHGRLAVARVTARAVASLDKLARWSVPLLTKGGGLAVLKGERAADEVESAQRVLRKLGVAGATVHEVRVPMSEMPARVVTAHRRT